MPNFLIFLFILFFLENLSQNSECEPLHDEINPVDDIESDVESTHSDHCTDSEQSEDDDDGIEYDDPENIVLGKDNTTAWHKNPPQQNVRMRKHNIVTHLPGVKRDTKCSTTPIACWSLFFPDSMISHIVQYTNLYLDKLRPNYSRPRDVRETDVHELKALFGLLYMAGVKKAQHLNVKELWDTDGSAPECFRATMSKERFLLLLRALRFDNFEDRAERKRTDNLASIREVLDEFIKNCKANYQVGEYSTIDEMLELFRG